ncbi:SMI1/KNR4 family protein [Capnocytophaga periodontitidis]|uniref:SMI1/KNR4 family protein n=1 Tax=Capnocytophaga periodontitidis TaxID=2795027 RepID=UPI0018E1B213|nr:SMI1/KNR4 family protein [Capnocytophaga periodontitidis]MBI1667874.1 SMI1/KNR4 family protein [Capnocytophaga periodontitidis]
MNIDKIIEKLGGIVPLYPRKQTYPNEEYWAKVEKLVGEQIPSSYKLFATKYGVSTPNNLLKVVPFTEEAEYQHPEDIDIPNYTFEETSLSVFFGKGTDYDLVKTLKEFKKRMPAKFLPIADDGMGNLIVLCLDSTNFEKVYFWDGNVEWDEEDYLEETGMMMPEEAKFQNLWLIGLSFENFWERLSIDEWE